MTREHIIVLRVVNDDETQPWWDAMGLPDPSCWTGEDTFGPTVYAKVELVEEVKRGASE